MAVGGFSNTSEVIDLASKKTSCNNLADFPAPNVRALAGLDNNYYPIVCGGTTAVGVTNMCYTYIPSTKSWNTSSPLTSAREGAAYTTVSAPSSLGILVAGGRTTNKVFLCTMESLDRITNIWSSANLASVPECLAYSCMVQLSSSQIFLTGGYNSNGEISRTYIYNTVTNVWTSGPDLLTVRAEHACGIINDSNNNPTVIVAGGWSDLMGRSMSTTEIYNHISNKWDTGPELPLNFHTGVIMPHPQGGVVCVAGNSFNNGISNLLNTIYYLPSISSYWSILNQTLHVARGVHTVINVPSAFTQC